MIKLDKVSKVYTNENNIVIALNEVSLSFEKGEIVAITGESGSGKTTLVNVISGIDFYQDGEMYFNGNETSHFSTDDWGNYAQENIGFIFQNPYLIEHYTVYENIALASSLKNYVVDGFDEKIKGIIKDVGLDGFENQIVAKLSGGQRQRVVIARELCKGANIIVADEPTGNLDSETSKKIIELIAKISKDKLVLIITHNFEEVKDIINRKIELEDGKVVDNIKIRPLAKTTTNNSNFLIEKSYFPLNLIRKNITRFIGKKTLTMALYTFFLITFCFLIMFGVMFNRAINFAESESFMYTESDRIIVRKSGNESVEKAFSISELDKLNSNDRIKNIITNDLFLDTSINLQISTDSDYETYSMSPLPIKNLDDKSIDYGRIPKNDSEVVIVLTRMYNMYKDKVLNYEFVFRDVERKEHNLKIVGIVLSESDTNNYLYLTNDFFEKNRELYWNKNAYEINNSIIGINSSYKLNAPIIYKIENTLNLGEVMVENCINLDIDCIGIETKKFEISVIGSFFEKIKTLDIYSSTSNTNENYKNSTIVYLNEKDYNDIFKSDIYQISIFLDNKSDLDTIKKELNEYRYIIPYETIVNQNYYGLFITVFFIIMFLIATVLCVIIYVFLNLIYKNRVQEYGLLKFMGLTKKSMFKVIFIEEIFVLVISSLIVCLIMFGLTFVEGLGVVLNMDNIWTYIISFLNLLVVLSVFNYRFTKKIYKNPLVASLKGRV